MMNRPLVCSLLLLLGLGISNVYAVTSSSSLRAKARQCPCPTAPTLSCPCPEPPPFAPVSPFGGVAPSSSPYFMSPLSTSSVPPFPQAIPQGVQQQVPLVPAAPYNPTAIPPQPQAVIQPAPGTPMIAPQQQVAQQKSTSTTMAILDELEQVINMRGPSASPSLSEKEKQEKIEDSKLLAASTRHERAMHSLIDHTRTTAKAMKEAKKEEKLIEAAELATKLHLGVQRKQIERAEAERKASEAAREMKKQLEIAEEAKIEAEKLGQQAKELLDALQVNA